MSQLAITQMGLLDDGSQDGVSLNFIIAANDWDGLPSSAFSLFRYTPGSSATTIDLANDTPASTGAGGAYTDTGSYSLTDNNGNGDAFSTYNSLEISTNGTDFVAAAEGLTIQNGSKIRYGAQSGPGVFVEQTITIAAVCFGPESKIPVLVDVNSLKLDDVIQTYAGSFALSQLLKVKPEQMSKVDFIVKCCSMQKCEQFDLSEVALLESAEEERED